MITHRRNDADRALCAFDPEWSGRTAHASRSQGHYLVFFLQPFKDLGACLLYTSDAADDSVLV